AAGIPPRFYYLRTQGGVEVDLLIEGPNGLLQPYEFKLSQTPRTEMAAGLLRFANEFAELGAEPGCVVSLSAKAGPLARGVALVPLWDFLGRIAAVGRI